MAENKPTQAKCAEIVSNYIQRNPSLTRGITTLICQYSDSPNAAIFKISSEENMNSHTIEVMFDHELIYTRIVDAKPRCMLVPVFINEKTIEEAFQGQPIPPDLVGGISRIYGVDNKPTCSVVSVGEVLVFISLVTQQCIVHNRNHLLTIAEDSNQVVARHHK